MSQLLRITKVVFCLGLVAVFAEHAQAGPWTPEVALPGPRAHFGVATVDDGIFVFGGTMPSAPQTNSCYSYHPGSASVPRSAMPNAVTTMGYTVHDGQVWSIGGYREGSGLWGRLTEVHSYDPALDTWSTRPSLSYERADNGAASLGGYVYTVGGHHEETGHGFTLSRVDRYSVGGAWEERASLKQDSRIGVAGGAAGKRLGRSNLGVVAVQDKIYAVGGSSAEYLYHAGVTGGWLESYDPATNTWDDTLPPMPTARSAFAVAAWGDRIYTIGGELPGSVVTNVVEYFDVSEGAWFSDTPFPEAVYGARAAVLGDRLYVLGGRRGADYSLSNAVYSIPEPATCLLLALGGLVLIRRR